MVNLENFNKIVEQLPQGVKLIAVSKTKPVEEILHLYHAGQIAFGENRTQELHQKHAELPNDIEWHFIGHLQSNKVKYIAPFVSLIHSIDTFKLLQEVDRQAKKLDRKIPCLLQFHIATEESKFGFSYNECEEMLKSDTFQLLQNAEIVGVMGMATFTDDVELVRQEFRNLKAFFTTLKEIFFNGNPLFKEISMGMTNDYQIAIEEGSTMIRVGSAIFGERFK